MVAPSPELRCEVVTIAGRELMIVVPLLWSEQRSPPVGLVNLEWKIVPIIITIPTTPGFGFMPRCVHSALKMGAFPFT
jgi:hypothetical protein